MSQYEPMYDSFGSSQRYVPNSRMSVSYGVFLPGGDVDMLTGQLKPDYQRRCRTQGKRLEMERLEREEKALEESVAREMSKGGVRISRRLGVFLIALLLFSCGLYVLVQQSAIVERQKDINRLERGIADCRAQNELIQEQIDEASDAAVICYAAARDLNMIPAESVTAIHLVSVNTRPLETQQTTAQASSENADVQAADNTPIPMTASH